VPRHYRFAAPNTNCVLLPGYRIMVRIQPTLFPLYDRNPQNYVDNILFAKPSEYQMATATVLRAGMTE
jgi:predicted acyl esterase